MSIQMNGTDTVSPTLFTEGSNMTLISVVTTDKGLPEASKVQLGHCSWFSQRGNRETPRGREKQVLIKVA